MSFIAGDLLPFPNPLDGVIHWVAGETKDLFDKILRGIVNWVFDGVGWAFGQVMGFIDGSTGPNVQAQWFAGSRGPWATMLSFAAVLIAIMVLLGIIHGVVRGDPAAVFRTVFTELPATVLGIFSILAIVNIGLGVTDWMSAEVTANFGGDLRDFASHVTEIVNYNQQFGVLFGSIFALLFGVGMPIGCAVIFVELIIRSSLVYVLVALSPLAFAINLFPALKGSASRLGRLLGAVILSKLVIAICLALGAAALGAGAGATVNVQNALVPPGAEGQTGDVSALVGVLMAGAAITLLAAFSPLILLKLFPTGEVAHGAQQGVKSGLAGIGASSANHGRSLAGKASSGPETSAPRSSGPAGTSSAGGGALGAKAGPAAPAAVPAVATVAAGKQGKQRAARSTAPSEAES